MSSNRFGTWMKHARKQTRIVSLALLTYFCVFLSPSLKSETNLNLDALIQQRTLEKQRLTNERRDTLNQIGVTEKRTVRVLEALTILGRNIEQSQEKLDRLKASVLMLKKEIINTSMTIEKLEQSIETDKIEISRQLEVLYTLGRIRQMTLFIGLNSFQHYFRNRRLLQLNTQLDVEVLTRLNQNLVSLVAERKVLDEQQSSLNKLKEQEEELNQLLKFERQQQVTYLRHLRTDRSAHVRYLREIQVKLEQLNDSLDSLAIKKENQEKTSRFQGFRNHKKKLPSPVIGKIVHSFGQRQSPFYTLFRRGVLVETRSDASVRSVLDGKVVWAGPFRGYQNLVILDHGKGSLSVYGNLNEIFVLLDDVVDQGYVLGSVGFDEVEERSLFYFEMRYNKRAVNPSRWLKEPRWKN